MRIELLAELQQALSRSEEADKLREEVVELKATIEAQASELRRFRAMIAMVGRTLSRSLVEESNGHAPTNGFVDLVGVDAALGKVHAEYRDEHDHLQMESEEVDRLIKEEEAMEAAPNPFATAAARAEAERAKRRERDARRRRERERAKTAPTVESTDDPPSGGKPPDLFVPAPKEGWSAESLKAAAKSIINKGVRSERLKDTSICAKCRTIRLTTPFNALKCPNCGDAPYWHYDRFVELEFPAIEREADVGESPPSVEPYPRDEPAMDEEAALGKAIRFGEGIGVLLAIGMATDDAILGYLKKWPTHRETPGLNQPGQPWAITGGDSPQFFYGHSTRMWPRGPAFLEGAALIKAVRKYLKLKKPKAAKESLNATDWKDLGIENLAARCGIYATTVGVELERRDFATLGDIAIALRDGTTFDEFFDGHDFAADLGEALRMATIAYASWAKWTPLTTYPDGIPLEWLERGFAGAHSTPTPSTTESTPAAEPLATWKSDDLEHELWHALNGAGKGMWAPLVQNGATYDEIANRLEGIWPRHGRRFVPPAQSGGKFGHTVQGGKHAAFWIGKADGSFGPPATLVGSALINRIRAIMCIPSPSEAAKNAKATFRDPVDDAIDEFHGTAERPKSTKRSSKKKGRIPGALTPE